MCFFAYFYWFKKLFDQFDQFISFILRFGLHFRFVYRLLKLLTYAVATYMRQIKVLRKSS